MGVNALGGGPCSTDLVAPPVRKRGLDALGDHLAPCLADGDARGDQDQSDNDQADRVRCQALTSQRLCRHRVDRAGVDKRAVVGPATNIRNQKDTERLFWEFYR